MKLIFKILIHFIINIFCQILIFLKALKYKILYRAQEISITCENEEQLDFVLGYEENNDFDFLKVSQLPPENVQVLVTKNQVSNFKMQLDQHGIKYNVLVEDFQKIIDEESKAQRRAQMLATRSSLGDENDIYNFDHFPRHNAVRFIYYKLIYFNFYNNNKN